ncbi:cobalt-precorrin-5B (C(1))-methyltransferase CbiD [Sulfolobaceae archaeon RB850M]|nr:cobalt-precorrin-5B (C(1))-methyltransferase CbiD [Stygiolobus sp.]
MSLITTLKRFGITTGAAASAAAKASVIFLKKDETPKSVTIPTPIGLRLEIPVENYEKKDDKACAEVRKFSGDNPDILDGVVINACSKCIDSDDVIVKGGEGIGVITRPGLKGEVGSKAISPTALEMIKEAVKEVVDKGVEVEISVPNGEVLAKNTMNPVVGVVNGISILGTTGIEYPVSDEDYLDHIRTEMCVIKQSSPLIVLAPGNTSFEIAKKMYGDAVVKIGDRVGDSVRLASELGFSHIIVVSLPGKLVKVSAGILNTHNKYGDARIETLTHACVLAGIQKLDKIANSLTVSEALTYLTDEEKERVFKIICDKALKRLKALSKAKIGVIAIDEKGKVLAYSGEV